METIAIDAVLLPDAYTNGHAIGIATANGLRFSETIALNATDCLPHLSLAMGVMDRAALATAAAALHRIASAMKKPTLHTNGVRKTDLPAAGTVVDLPINPSPTLQRLHESVMRELEPLFSYTISKDAVAPPPPVNVFTLDWIARYRTHAGFERFDPHITLGFGELRLPVAPVTFEPARLALCHLGNWCTCRRILVSVPFEPELNNPIHHAYT